MLTVSLLVCAMMALAIADDNSTVSLTSLAIPAVPSCPDGWSELAGRCFLFVPRELSWADAEKNCQSMKGNLASVHNVEEYQHIQGIIKAQTQASPITWVGGSDCQQNGVWFWSDGTAFTFSFWCSGEPNNQGGNQGCLQINHGDNNCWDDVSCSTTHPSVCGITL